MSTAVAVALVNRWIEDYRIYLKDGGGAAGVHTKARDALVERIAAALASDPDQPRAAPKRKSKVKSSGQEG